ncbi:hypothetical protein AB0L57_05940 [Nocardia sp. NPDC052254]|uniref:hypothetical protein n=1 Tax=Nocardia sp. NPDC052254 TaxID=3155681 RepID=UPI00341C6648
MMRYADDTDTYLDQKVRELHAALDRTDGTGALRALGDIRRAVGPDAGTGRVLDRDLESRSGEPESTYRLTLITIAVVLFIGAFIAILAR